MNESKISVRYAKALFLLAVERDLIDDIRDDMTYILELSSLEDVKEMLNSFVISGEIKQKALEEITRDKMNDASFNLIKLVLENNREMFLPGIARSYMEQADNYRGVTRAKLTTAFPADESTVERLRSVLGKRYGGEVILNLHTDASITGGFLLSIGDTFIDGSVRTQLRKIKKELIEE